MKPLARIVAYATSGVAPKDDIHAAPGAGHPSGPGKGESAPLGAIDLFELNEAFAAQMLACGKELGLDEASLSTSTAERSCAGPIRSVHPGRRVLVTFAACHALEYSAG